jgi:hypothetical protein
MQTASFISHAAGPQYIRKHTVYGFETDMALEHYLNDLIREASVRQRRLRKKLSQTLLCTLQIDPTDG